MYDVFQYWHYKVAEAYAEGDMDLARAYCVGAAAHPDIFDQNALQDHALRLVLARHDDNRQWLAEAEAALERNRFAGPATSVPHEAAVTARLLCGLMRRAEPHVAAAHFSAALQLAPDFLPARVELELLAAPDRRDALFGALGVPLPRQDWRYTLAASELGLLAGRSSFAQRVAAICLRGLCTPQTPALVRLYRALNPDARIFVATWRETPAELIDELAKVAEVVLVDDTEHPGVQNRNRQLLLARAVLGAAKEAGFGYVLLTRVDIALFQPDVLSPLLGLLQRFPPEPGRLLSRIVVPDIYTRRYLPFHISDFMSFGAVPDLLLQWSAPIATDGDVLPPEQYIHWAMRESLEVNFAQPDIPTYQAFLRKYFVVRDFDWFGGLWTKQPELRNGSRLRLRDSCLSHSDWERMYYAADPSTQLDLIGGGNLSNGVMLQSALDIHRYG